MLFNSHLFVFSFLPVVLVGAALLARWRDGRLVPLWLLGASLAFYAHWDAPLLALLIFSIGFNWCIGTTLCSPGAPVRTRRLLLALGITANLVLLAQCKYARFFAGVANDLGGDFALPPVILPLAISFFTFQQIAFLVDAHRGNVERPRFLRYALFVAFFPQLIAGPIVTHAELLPQLAKRNLGPTARRLAVGLSLFVIGLSKKVLIADQIARVADPIFEAAAAGSHPAVLDAWGGALAYSFQLYFDFSGYSDMAIGLGFMFGVRLPLNFASPYKAESIADFWRRWHMTLSRFLRDYLYIPLGGNRRGPTRRHINVVLTMLLGGLWHGAGWSFVWWGGLHGLYLVVNHTWKGLCARRAWTGGRLTPFTGAASRVLTFTAVVVAWVFFRAPTADAALTLLGAMAGLGGGEAAELSALAWTSLAALLALVWFAPNSQELVREVTPPAPDGDPGTAQRTPWLAWRPSPGWGLALGALALLAVTDMVQRSEFIYFRF